MSWWTLYHGRCMGRVIHFLYHYCNLDVAEQSIIGERDVTYRGKRIATFGWCESFGEADVPAFTFEGEGEHAARWTEAQIERREEAIVKALPAVPAGEHVAVVPEVIHAFDPKICHRSRLWSKIVAKTEPAYSVANEVLYCRAGEHWFYWSRAIGDWLRAAAPEG